MPASCTMRTTSRMRSSRCLSTVDLVARQRSRGRGCCGAAARHPRRTARAGAAPPRSRRRLRPPAEPPRRRVVFLRIVPSRSSTARTTVGSTARAACRNARRARAARRRPSGSGGPRARGGAPGRRGSARSALRAAATRLARGSAPAPRASRRSRSPAACARRSVSTPRRGPAGRSCCAARTAIRGASGVTGSSPMCSSTRSEASQSVRRRRRCRGPARRAPPRATRPRPGAVRARPGRPRTRSGPRRPGPPRARARARSRRRPGSRSRPAARSPPATRPTSSPARCGSSEPDRVVQEHARRAELGQLARLLDERLHRARRAGAVDEAGLELPAGGVIALSASGGSRRRSAGRAGGRRRSRSPRRRPRSGARSRRRPAGSRRGSGRGARARAASTSRLQRPDPLPWAFDAAPDRPVEAAAARDLEVREAAPVENLGEPELLGGRHAAPRAAPAPSSRMVVSTSAGTAETYRVSRSTTESATASASSVASRESPRSTSRRKSRARALGADERLGGSPAPRGSTRWSNRSSPASLSRPTIWKSSASAKLRQTRRPSSAAQSAPTSSSVMKALRRAPLCPDPGLPLSSSVPALRHLWRRNDQLKLTPSAARDPRRRAGEIRGSVLVRTAVVRGAASHVRRARCSALARVDLDPVARVHEERHLDDRAGLEGRRLRHVRDRVALHAGLGVGDRELDRRRHLDADGRSPTIAAAPFSTAQERAARPRASRGSGSARSSPRP